VDKKPKKQRKKKPPIEIDQNRLRAYKEDIASGAFDNSEMYEKKRGPFPSHPGPKIYLPYLTRGCEDGFPSACSKAAHYCLTYGYPIDPLVKTRLLKLIEDEIERNPGNIQGGRPVDVDANLEIFSDFEFWRERMIKTPDGKGKHFTVMEAAKRIWLDRNPFKKTEDAGANELTELIERYYLARKRYFAKHYRDRLFP
jgi:hypothetical protein